MKIKMSINSKMLLSILTTSVIVFTLTVGYISVQTSKRAYLDAEKLVDEITQKNALTIERHLSENLTIVKVMAEVFKVYDGLSDEQWKSLFGKMYYNVFEKFEKEFNIYKLYYSWELYAYDSTWTKDYGRYSYVLSRYEGEIKDYIGFRSLDGDAGLYASFKSEPKNMIVEPYWDEHIEEGEEKQFMTSLLSPIVKNQRYVGLMGADIVIDEFQLLIEKINPFSQTVAFLVSNEGVIVAHTNKKNVGKKIEEIALEEEKEFHISTHIKAGNQKTFLSKDRKGGDKLIILNPIQVGELKNPWSLGIIVPKNVILKDSKETQTISIIVAFFGILILSLIIIIISRIISQSLKKTTFILEKLSLGEIEEVEKLKISTGDEIEDMAKSANQVIEGLIKTSKFASEIGEGNLHSEFTPLSNEDLLGNSLLDMRSSLIKAKEEEGKRKVEDEKLNWATTGQAKFGEILRNNSSDLEKLSFNVMSNLVNYLDANQGALFITEEKDKQVILKMQATIAYDRKKTIDRIIRIGEGLVGRCAFEQKTIYMTDIPDNYIHITSGMGTANPNVLLLVPLILNDEVFGVIELASFNKIEEYQLKFVERVAESIASTISTVKVNQKTTQLLNQSKQQAEELASQEEEMRQNMEELKATQEEAHRREYEMTGMLEALNMAAYIVEYDMNGFILKANDRYVQLFGTTNDKIVGKKHDVGYEITPELKNRYQKIWVNLKKGISQKDESKIKLNNKTFWLQENYYPVIDKEVNLPYKVVKISFNITQQKEKELEMMEWKAGAKRETELIESYKQEIKKLKARDSQFLLLKKQLESYQQEMEAKQEKQAKPNIEEKEKALPELSNDANELISWDKKYLLGIDEIDQQHEQIIKLANQLFANLKNDKSKKEIKESLKSFIDFTSYHLSVKEKYFEDFDYPQKDSYVSNYQKFIKEMEQFQKDYLSSKVKFLDDIVNKMKGWLFEQLLSNQGYVALFKKNGL